MALKSSCGKREESPLERAVREEGGEEEEAAGGGGWWGLGCAGGGGGEGQKWVWPLSGRGH